MSVQFAYYKTHHKPGWGSNRDAFPLLIITHDAAGKPVANIAGESWYIAQSKSIRPLITATMSASALESRPRSDR